MCANIRVCPGSARLRVNWDSTNSFKTELMKNQLYIRQDRKPAWFDKDLQNFDVYSLKYMITVKILATCMVCMHCAIGTFEIFQATPICKI